MSSETPDVSSQPQKLQAARHMVHGSLWMIGMRWSMKVIGLVSSIVLIRLLDAEDFGIVAKAIICVGLLEVFLDSGFKQALIQKKETHKEDYDTVFTLNSMMGTGIFTALFCLSPLFAHLMGDERLTYIIPLLGLRALVWGFSSPRTADFLRNLQYSKDFQFNVSVKLITVPSTIFLAICLQDYRALIGGQIISQIAELMLSYIMAPYKPSFGLKRAKEIWRFSLSFISLNYAIYATQRLDEMFLMRSGSQSNKMLGYYNVASMLGCLLTYEILYPLTRALFPVFARLKEDMVALQKAVRQVFGIVWALALLCGVGTALMGENIMLTLGGEKWRAAIIVLQWIGVASALQMVNLVVGTVLQVTERARIQSMLLWGNLCLLGVAFYIALPLCFQQDSLEPLALARVLVMGFFVPIHMIALQGSVKISLQEFFKEMWRPSVSMGVTFLVIQELYSLFHYFSYPVINLFLQMAAIGITYGAMLIILWLLCGRPEGFEAFLMRSLKKRKLAFSEEA